ncbi:uncharacterized protein LOC113127611 [Mastacembelus armatus]|uniref:uncharacterized protein LOC113127611 n=1 Tax=Mastacembelus armatus TaxID=205130 RepID=UPI000E45CC86|nr:uncharacterized protein LOC113127611 [Mastacembelus armatus]
MELLWLLLPLFLVWAQAESLREVKVQLEENVSLTCSENIPDIHWYMEIHSQLRACILRSFSGSDIIYCSPTFKTKYFLQNNRLVIRNVTADDCRLYFCGRKTNDNIVFVDSIRLVSDVPFTPSSNSSELNIQQPNCSKAQPELVVFSVTALNIIFSLVTTGLICALLWLKKKKKHQHLHLHQHQQHLQQQQQQYDHQGNGRTLVLYENNQRPEVPQYAEVQFPTHPVPPSAASSDGIYYKAQMPQSILPGH